MIMLGTLCRASRDFPVSEGKIKEAIGQIVPERLADLDISAFELGYGAGGP
jgi:hypothetical protein